MAMTAVDLHYLRAAAQTLEDFILSKETYWPIDRIPNAPADVSRLSLGGLLLAMARLNGQDLSGDQAAEYGQNLEKVQAVQSQWRTHWEAKARQELDNRLKLWQNFLQEALADPARHQAQYRNEVRLRTMIELLRHSAGSLDDAAEKMIAGLDARLRGHFQPGEFIIAAEYQPAFPPERYWFLYGNLKQ